MGLLFLTWWFVSGLGLRPNLPHVRQIRMARPMAMKKFLMLWMMKRFNLPNLPKAMAILSGSSSPSSPPMSEKLDRSRARKRLRMTRLPMRTVARKYGTQLHPATNMQSHIDSKKKIFS